MKSSDPVKPSVEHRDLPQKHDRGRNAEKPTDVPKEGWLDILSRTKQQLREDNLSIVAAGVAFYGFVAVVPAIAVMVALYGLIADPSQVAEHLAALSNVLPGEVVPLLKEQMVRIAGDSTTAGIGAIVGVVLALYSSANATKALITGMNIAYGEKEERNFLKLTAIAMGLTLAAIVGVVVAVGLLAVLPTILDRLHVAGSVELMLNILRWPLVIGGFMAALAVIYRYGPDRDDAKWRWISPGAGVAAFLWLVGSALFSLYVSKAGSYDQVYGPLGAVVVFLMWLFLTAFVVLIGAELNAELERQTINDTTEGERKPMGLRDAHAADTVGPSRHKLPEPKET
jgi:membrane protein